MPSRAPTPVDPRAVRDLESLGSLVRQRRKSMRIAAESVARAANMSRQTLHRIEHGEPSVTIGAYVSALRALGLELRVVGVPAQSAAPAHAEDAVDTIRLADYPQLRQLAWHRQGETVDEDEALALYERNWRHIDVPTLTPTERGLIARLVSRHGRGGLLV